MHAVFTFKVALAHEEAQRLIGTFCALSRAQRPGILCRFSSRAQGPSTLPAAGAQKFLGFECNEGTIARSELGHLQCQKAHTAAPGRRHDADHFEVSTARRIAHVLEARSRPEPARVVQPKFAGAAAALLLAASDSALATGTCS